jgi:hypothetical protein
MNLAQKTAEHYIELRMERIFAHPSIRFFPNSL